MNKLIAGFCIMFFFLSILSGIMDGAAGAAASTDLTATIDDSVVIIPVTSTVGFLNVGGVLIIGNEKIHYTGVTPVTFTGGTRGYENTEAAGHDIGRAVYNEDAGMLNYALGFQIVETEVTGGIIGAAWFMVNFVIYTVPRIILWDYAFLEGELMILRYALQAMSAGFAIYLTFTLGVAAFNMIRKLFPV